MRKYRQCPKKTFKMPSEILDSFCSRPLLKLQESLAACKQANKEINGGKSLLRSTTNILNLL